MRDMEQEQVHAGMSYKKRREEHIYGPPVPNFNEPEHVASRTGPFVAAAQIRQQLYRMFLRQVAKLGFTASHGKHVARYFEFDVAGKGGVVLENGDNGLADVVVAADGLRSRSELQVCGEEPTFPRSSSMSVYRTSFPREMAKKDELVREGWGDLATTWVYWLGPRMHIGIWISDDLVGWGFTPRDEVGAPTETRGPDNGVEEVVKALLRAPDWDPAVAALIRASPEKGIIHRPLLWRDLRREWTSHGGRVVQVGDSAHSLTPTSGNGATQALGTASRWVLLGKSANAKDLEQLRNSVHLGPVRLRSGFVAYRCKELALGSRLLGQCGVAVCGRACVGQVWNRAAVALSLGITRAARRKVETTLTTMDGSSSSVVLYLPGAMPALARNMSTRSSCLSSRSANFCTLT
ncbi:Aromatic-ring hydroxylase-like protein [Metarhizium album ARSEF 1941]|uniref:Aromatic-ring hydroxylase-like protein n=1 Tax=Metarhizium album (strain ARSEF 1941) TaxID=1081103 RepID=A0A0B2WXG0_METAS|nr:Aromatic-ring hydroxylase-like protein [Metarhizium album ARSEF 1941]KHN97560.1 Aromatic-ring hydroxylase-like protein [Metarhizium album ARSEF 1941]